VRKKSLANLGNNIREGSLHFVESEKDEVTQRNHVGDFNLKGSRLINLQPRQLSRHIKETPLVISKRTKERKTLFNMLKRNNLELVRILRAHYGK